MQTVGYALLRDAGLRAVGAVVLVPESVFDAPRQRRIVRDHLADAANFVGLTIVVATRRTDGSLDFATEDQPVEQLVERVDWRRRLEWSEALLTWPDRRRDRVTADAIR